MGLKLGCVVWDATRGEVGRVTNSFPCSKTLPRGSCQGAYWLVYRQLRLLIGFAFGSHLLEVAASFSWKTTQHIS